MPNRTTDRRRSLRLPPSERVRAACYEGADCLGPNLAIALVDVSDTGAGLLLREPLEPDQTVHVTLSSSDPLWSVKREGIIRWSSQREDGQCLVGVEFDRPLTGDEVGTLT